MRNSTKTVEDLNGWANYYATCSQESEAQLYAARLEQQGLAERVKQLETFVVDSFQRASSEAPGDAPMTSHFGSAVVQPQRGGDAAASQDATAMPNPAGASAAPAAQEFRFADYTPNAGGDP